MASNSNNTNGKTTRKKDEITCIQLTKDTRNKLAKLGTMDDTFESTILRLIAKPSCGSEIGENESE